LTGVEALLVEKSKETPSWSPATLEEVTSDIVSRFFDPKSPYLEGVPSLTAADETHNRTPNAMKYALPSEEEIGSVVRGLHSSGGEMSLQTSDLVARFAELRPGKMGMKEKILEVVERRCDLIDNADGNRVWLKWKH
jgi:3-hydroxyisobutyryl-CoA hydrolase